MEVASGGEKHGFGDIEGAIAALARGTDVDYDGPSGTLDIDESHIVPGSYYTEVAAKKADGSGLQYTELTDPPRQTLTAGALDDTTQPTTDGM